jgi:hypothetical protein
MMRFCIALWWLVWVSVSPALAQLYRWTDDAGKIHITDNPATIPPAYRERARSSTSEAPAADTNATPPAVAPSSPRLPTPSQPLSQDASAAVVSQIQELQQQITTARQERQAHLEQLRDERPIHATPEFVRQRRQIAEAGRALLTVEQQIDTLSAALEQAQQQLQARQTPAAQSPTGFDKEGQDETYWQRRLRAVRDRMSQAQAQRRDLLSQLGAAAGEEQRVAERQGRTLLQLAQALQQAEQDIDAAEAALQAIKQEALVVGAPAAWLQ